MTLALAAHRRTSAEFLRLGQSALRAGRLAEARRALQAAVAADPHDAAAWQLLARLSSPRARLAYLTRALEINPHDVRLREELGRARRAVAAAAQSMAPQIYTLPGPKLWLAAGTLGVALLILLGTVFTHPPSQTSSVALPLLANSLQLAPQEQQVAVGAVVANVEVAQSAARGSANAPLEQALALAEAGLPSPTFTPPPTATPIPATQVVVEPTVTPTLIPTDAPAPDLLPPDPAAIAEGGRWIDINLSAQTLTAYEGPTPLNMFVVSTGTWQYPTVTGQYNVYVKYVAADMSGPGYYLPSVPYVMYFYRGYGIHGTYWHNNFGTPMSHGCVNMSTEEAGWIFDWASVGTLVNVHY